MKTLKGIVIQKNMIQTETGELLKYENPETEIGDPVTVCMDYTSGKVIKIITKNESEDNYV